jgi:hypothetical protein
MCRQKTLLIRVGPKFIQCLSTKICERQKTKQQLRERCVYLFVVWDSAVRDKVTVLHIDSAVYGAWRSGRMLQLVLSCILLEGRPPLSHSLD